MLGRAKIVAALGAAAVAAGGVYAVQNGTGYEVTMVAPSAAQIVSGSPVLIDGFEAGQVDRLEVRDGKALIVAELSDEYAPLHEGTTSQIEWKDAVGERVVTIHPGPAGNAEIPDGGMFTAESRQVEVDQVLSMLDAKTRQRLTSLLGGLNTTVSGSETDFRDTVRAAGPAVKALGEVLRAVGQDGPAIRALVNQVHEMTEAAARRRADLAGIVTDLNGVTGAMADKQRQLSQGLNELPKTLRAAHGTLVRVPKAADETVPLLEDLQPATARLPRLSRNLSPLLRDLRPATADLRSTLGRTQELLRVTPGLLDAGHAVVPQLTYLMREMRPVAAFLRPYAPEAVGWFHNWGQNFAPYDSQGHVWAAVLAPGSNAVNESLVQPPGSHTSPRPCPGEAVGQAWTDATGSCIQ